MLKTSADLPNDIEALKALVLSQQTERKHPLKTTYSLVLLFGCRCRI